jgi:hypothetical protein
MRISVVAELDVESAWTPFGGQADRPTYVKVEIDKRSVK